MTAERDAESHGHSVCLQGNYSLALNEYMHAYRLAPQEPLVLLCIGVALLNQVMQKKVPDRDRAVLQCFAFLQASACLFPSITAACLAYGSVHLTC